MHHLELCCIRALLVSQYFDEILEYAPHHVRCHHHFNPHLTMCGVTIILTEVMFRYKRCSSARADNFIKYVVLSHLASSYLSPYEPIELFEKLLYFLFVRIIFLNFDDRKISQRKFVAYLNTCITWYYTQKYRPYNAVRIWTVSRMKLFSFFGHFLKDHFR